MERDVTNITRLLISVISTHTLTWSVTSVKINTCTDYFTFQLTRSRGAWQLRKSLQRKSLQFQLTRSRGAWLNSSCFKYVIWQFQLTRSRGAWRSNGKTYAVCKHFNSHAHVERDDKSYLYFFTVIISTHTLTWSVTITYYRLAYDTDKFQLTRSCGAWRTLMKQNLMKL